MQTINERIEALRAKMTALQIDAVLIPSNDPHQSEYVADYWKIREYFSGFTGSAGTLVVTHSHAALWTDSRYFLQVEEECKKSIVELHKQIIPHAPEHIPWLKTVLHPDCRIALDYRLFTNSQIEHLYSVFTNDLIIMDLNGIIETIWVNRPQISTSYIVDHLVEYCGQESNSKIEKIQNLMMKGHKGDCFVISRLDNIAWTFNIRLEDFAFDPSPQAFAIIGKTDHHLFTNIDCLTTELISRLEKDKVQLHPYDQFLDFIGTINPFDTILYEKGNLNYAIFSKIQSDQLHAVELIQPMQAKKNAIEIENVTKCMIKDGVALTRFYIWLEEHLKENTISEYELGQKLESFRKEQELYKGESFSAIVGYNQNGAIIHYSAPKNGSAQIFNDGILLLDSGAQYENGTTDITRTVWLGGNVPQEIKNNYTAVLKGYIALDTLVFPKGTSGVQIDAFARAPLWKLGLEYGHGTGHGVGVYGLVHEPLQGFATSTTTSRGSTGHEENQISTIEPGYYKNGHYGIRIENCVLSKVVKSNDGVDFIGFEALTLFPIDTQMIDKYQLTNEEISWLNNYHKKVLAVLKLFLEKDEIDWLEQKCQSI